jgi:hypothetical protein
MVSHVAECVNQSTLALNKRGQELRRSGWRWWWKVLIATSPTKGTEVMRHLQNAQLVIIDDARRIVDKSCNYVKLNSLERIIHTINKVTIIHFHNITSSIILLGATLQHVHIHAKIYQQPS